MQKTTYKVIANNAQEEFTTTITSSSVPSAIQQARLKAIRGLGLAEDIEVKLCVEDNLVRKTTISSTSKAYLGKIKGERRRFVPRIPEIEAYAPRTLRLSYAPSGSKYFGLVIKKVVIKSSSAYGFSRVDCALPQFQQFAPHSALLFRDQGEAINASLEWYKILYKLNIAAPLYILEEAASRWGNFRNLCALAIHLQQKDS